MLKSIQLIQIVFIFAYNIKEKDMKDFLKLALAVYLLGLIIGIIESI